MSRCTQVSVWHQVSSEILWYQPHQDPLLSTVHHCVTCYYSMHQANILMHFNTVQQESSFTFRHLKFASVHKKPRSKDMATLHNVEHKKSFSYNLLITQVIWWGYHMPFTCDREYQYRLWTYYNVQYHPLYYIIKICYKWEMTVGKLHHL